MAQTQEGEWVGESAAGCPKFDTWPKNPQFALVPSRDGVFEVTLTQASSSKVPIGVIVMKAEEGVRLTGDPPLSAGAIVSKSKFKPTSSQTLKVSLTQPAPGACYVLLPCTFEPNQPGKFSVTVSSDGAEFRFGPHAAGGGSSATSAPALPPLKPALGSLPPVGKAAPLAPAAAASSGEAEVMAIFRKQQAAGGLYEDPEFKSSSLRTLYASGQATAKSRKVDNWARLHQLGGSGAASSAMVIRPGLADTHVLAALGMVMPVERLAAQLLVRSEPALGMAAFRFFKNGAWRTVLVDDSVPCHGKRQPAYSSNEAPRDGVVCLVQKALAKLYGAYDQLANGVGNGNDRVGSVLEDLTGGVSDKIYLRDTPKQLYIQAKAEIESGALWTRVNGLLAEGHLLGAAYSPSHAVAGEEPAMPAASSDGTSVPHLVYPLVDLKTLDDDVKMVKLRNPWSKVHDRPAPVWSGDWSQLADQWQNRPKDAQTLERSGKAPRDGSFWMPWDRFIAGFNKLHILRLPAAHSATHSAAWERSTAGGSLSISPGAPWRSNPQYQLTVGGTSSTPQRLLITLSQPDAQLDGNADSSGYPNAIGCYLLKTSNGATNRRKLSFVGEGELLGASRQARSRQVCLEVELEPSSPSATYALLPCTFEPNITMGYTLSVNASVPVSLTPLPTDGSDWKERTLSGRWSSASNTAGGCPNNPSWVANPQFKITVSAPATLVGVLCLAMPASQMAALQAEQDRLSLAGQAEQAAAMAPAIGFLILKSDGGLISGSYEEKTADTVCASNFATGTQEVSAEASLSAGTYTLIACTFEAGQEADLALTLYCTEPSFDVVPLNGGTVAKPAERGTNMRHQPQGNMGPAGGAGMAQAPPRAKHDVRALRRKMAETEDDGKIGPGQLAEIEEAKKLEKWKENVPLMTIEGQPLSDNVKKERDQKIAFAVSQAQANGGLFEDAEFPPNMPGRAAGSAQPAVYNTGVPEPGMPVVSQWLRPREFAPKHTPPMLFQNDWEVEGVVQGKGLDNRWFLSACNIVAGNRDQLDRAFMETEAVPLAQQAELGFFIIKIYKDDPFSDDDWQVILVDDRLPCDANGTPVFARCANPSSYWVMILEKAYAKFCGTYQAMDGGTVTQGLEDLTGGVGYKFDLEKEAYKMWIPPKGDTPERLWDEMMEKMKTEHVVGCACNTRGEPRPQTESKGIVINRAYAMVTGGDFEDHRLMRMRIPLDEEGRAREWTGKWSDDSPAWNSRLRQMLHFSKKNDDGTFWIEYEDFCRHFNKVYMCRMLDDLWTRFAVKSRWMDETAGGCTNFISWRSNNQWLLTITRPATKLTIKLTQPDARKSTGHGRHYSNAIGFYILRGNAEPGDHKRRKLIVKPGGEEEDGDFIFVKEPKFSRQVTVEYTFERPSPTPYVLLPFMFEPGREAFFKLTILSDDRDDDGQPDFGFEHIGPETDWKSTCLKDTWSKGGAGNQLGEEDSAGGPLNGPGSEGAAEPAWYKNWQFQITLTQRTRCFIFLELRDVDHDMREVEGMQTEPDYPTVGFSVLPGEGDHIKLEGSGAAAPKVLQTAELRRGDGQWLELGYLEPSENKYVVIPYTHVPGVEHKYAITLYSDHEHKFEKIKPRSTLVNCIQCQNPSGLSRVMSKLESLEAKYAMMMDKEKRLKARGMIQLGRTAPPVPPPLGKGVSSGTVAKQFDSADVNHDGRVDKKEFQQYDAARKKFAEADKDGDGVISEAELQEYASRVEAHAREQHAQYVAELQKAEQVSNQLRQQLAELMGQTAQLPAVQPQPAAPPPQPPAPDEAGGKDKSKACLVM